MHVMGAVSPEKDSVIIFVGLIVYGLSVAVDLTIWPSAPQSKIVGIRDRDELWMRIRGSGGSGGG